MFSGVGLETINKNAGANDVKNLLARLTDEDFNGNNGEDYYIRDDGYFMSKLDHWMRRLDEYKTLEAFIRDVLVDNYSDPYYYDYDIKIKDMGNTLAVACASTS